MKVILNKCFGGFCVSQEAYELYAKKKGTDYCSLPWFRKGTMYKGMETDKEYTLEELGL